MERSARTPDEIIKVFKQLSAAQGPEVGERWLEGKGYPQAAESVRQAREALAEAGRRGAAVIAETMTAAQAPALPPGTGLAPQAEAGSGDLLAIGDGMQSPFWQTGDPAAAGSAPEPAKPLHQMNSDEFAAHAAATFGAYGRAAGFDGPIWQQ